MGSKFPVLYFPSLLGLFFLYYFTLSLKTIIFKLFIFFTVYFYFLSFLPYLSTFSNIMYLFRGLLSLDLAFYTAL